MQTCLHQCHITSIGTPNHSRSRNIQSLVFRQNLRHGMHVVKSILPTPITVNVFGVRETIASGTAHIRYEDSKSAQGKVLDQRHRKPGEIGAFLSLWATMNVINYRTQPFKAKSFGG